jgi:hypothetical protein
MSWVLAGRVRDVGPKHLWFWLGSDFILVPLELDISTIRAGSRVVYDPAQAAMLFRDDNE